MLEESLWNIHEPASLLHFRQTLLVNKLLTIRTRRGSEHHTITDRKHGVEICEELSFDLGLLLLGFSDDIEVLDFHPKCQVSLPSDLKSDVAKSNDTEIVASGVVG